ncbi:hypothetical protein AB9P05_00045 [Roseivirga sp. BDSF3-8]|uniref:hypothetical protein n=1 Tax=Roseivirga sp. BDSF3-8 TaxID=3241598 RepID=UPI003531D517
MFQKAITLLLCLSLFASCSKIEDEIISDEVTDLITITEIRPNGISYSITGENLDKLKQYDGRSFRYKGHDMLLQYPTSNAENKRQGDLIEVPAILLSSSFPKYGDIFVSSSVAEYDGGSIYNNCQTRSGGTLIEIKSDSEWGDPSLLLQAHTRVNGANGRWLQPLARITRYVGTTSPYEPGNYELISFKIDCGILSNCEDYPMARGRATWSSSYYETYTIIKCDD